MALCVQCVNCSNRAHGGAIPGSFFGPNYSPQNMAGTLFWSIEIWRPFGQILDGKELRRRTQNEARELGK